MTAAPDRQVRLAYERRTRPIYAIVAAVAGLLLVAWVLLTATGAHPKVDEATLRLIVENKRGGRDIAGAIIEMIDTFAIVATLLFLLGAARARNPNVPGWVRPVALVAAGLSIATVVFTILYVHKAHQFVGSGDQSYQEAQRLAGGSALAVFQIAGFLGGFLLALVIVLTSLQAMRVGLLTRFTGYLGMISGAVVIIATLFVAEAFWLFSLAVLFAGRWPTGEPPAWSSGEAVPWPSSQELREQRIRAAGGGKAARSGGKPQRGPAAKPKPADAGEAVATAGGGGTPARSGSASAAKRKRKKRR
jgi:hypothetical protein